MKLTAQEGGSFTLHPDGIHNAVCVDVIDRGLQTSQFGERHELAIVFETEQTAEDGKRQNLLRFFSASMNPKSNLYKFLGSWRGKQYSIGEEVDTDKLIGKSATLVVEHYQGENGERAKIASITKPQKSLTPSGEYDGQALRGRLDGNKPTEAPPEPETRDDVGF